MNVKKFLKKESKADLRSLETEEDREFLKQLQDSVSEKPPKKRSRHWLWAVPSAAAACVVAVVLIVEYVPFSNGGSNDIKYQAKDFVLTDSDMTELSGVLDHLTIQTNETQRIGVQRTYDSVSGDNLFFTLFVDESSSNALYNSEFVIVVNDKFDFEELQITDSFVTETYPTYTVNYSQEVIPDSETGLNLVRCSAKIESAHYEIYVIKYEEYSLADGMFLTVLNNLFTFQ